MKVLFVFGGLPHYFNKVMNRINAHPGIEVSVIAPREKSATVGEGVYETETGADFKILRLQEYKTWYGKTFFKDFKETIKMEKPDAIIIGWPYFLAFIFYPGLLLFVKRKKIRMISKEIPFTVPAYNESMNDFSSRCAESQKDEQIFSSKMVFTIHKLMRRYLYTNVFSQAVLYIDAGISIVKSYGLPGSAITVTHNSPDTDDIFHTIKNVKAEFPDLQPELYRILHVGRLVRWKNVHLLIEAVDRLKEKYPAIKLTIIGKGEEEAHLKDMTKSRQLENYVEFLGAIYEGKDQSIEMLRSRVYVLAGMGGLSINEAMAHALPVICSIADGTEKHLVYEGLNGFYFKDNDVESLIQAIEKMFLSDMDAMGQASLDIIRNKINIRTVSEKYIEALLMPNKN
jgi:glycosyltransferase involved in cell wall biosynthesis